MWMFLLKSKALYINLRHCCFIGIYTGWRITLKMIANAELGSAPRSFY